MLYGRRWSQVWVVTAIVASQIGSAEAHVGRGALAGRIVDPAGTAMPGATVTVVEVGTNRSRCGPKFSTLRTRLPSAHRTRPWGPPHLERLRPQAIHESYNSR